MFRIRTTASWALLTLGTACSGGDGGDGTGAGGGGGSGGSSLTDPMHTVSNGGSDASGICPALAAGSYTIHYTKLSQSMDCPVLEDQQLVVETTGRIVEPDLASSDSCTDRVTQEGCMRTRVVSCSQSSCSARIVHDVDRQTWAGDFTLTSDCYAESLTCRYDTWVTPR